MRPAKKLLSKFCPISLKTTDRYVALSVLFLIVLKLLETKILNMFASSNLKCLAPVIYGDTLISAVARMLT